MALLQPLLVALLGLLAAFTAAWISRSIKISEFRQGWIDELREDIASYMGLAEKWHRKWDELNFLPSDEKEKREREEAFPIANDAMVILWRIKLRINPEDNRFRAQDEDFLQSLDDLLNPGKAVPSWRHRANIALQKARQILKREWETTKKVQIPRRAAFQLEHDK